MDHREILQRNMADLYLAGELPAEESAQFEEHFFACPDCQRELEVAGSFRSGMRESGARGVVTFWTRPRIAAISGIAAALLIGIPSLLLNQRQATQLRSANDALASERTARQLDSKARNQLQSDVQMIWLDRSRSGGEETAATASAGAGWIVLSIPVPPGPPEGVWSIRLERASGGVVWQKDGLKPDRSAALSIVWPPGAVAAGDYRIEVSRTDTQGRTPSVGRFSFRLAQ
jgi:hypothetical protein